MDIYLLTSRKEMINQNYRFYIRKKIFNNPLSINIICFILFFPLVLFAIIKIKRKFLNYYTANSFVLGSYNREIETAFINLGLHHSHSKKFGLKLDDCIKGICETIEHESLHYTIHKILGDADREEELIVRRMIELNISNDIQLSID